MQLDLFKRNTDLELRGMTTCCHCSKIHSLNDTKLGETLVDGKQEFEHFCSETCKMKWWEGERDRRWPVKCANCHGTLRKSEATTSRYFTGKRTVTEYFCDDNCRRNLHIRRLNTGF